jgi:two-component sensor histidine kinase
MKKLFFIALIALLQTWLCGCGSSSVPGKLTNAQMAAIPLIDSLNSKAFAFYQVSIDTVFRYADSAYRLSVQNGLYQQKADATVHLAEYQRRKGDFSQALAYSLEARTYYHDNGLQKKEAGAMLQASVFYKEMGGEKKTRDFLNKGLAECEAAKNIYVTLADTAGLINTCSNKGIIYRDIANSAPANEYYFDTALIMFQQALAMQARSGKAEEQLGKLYNNISQVYNEHKKDRDTALFYLRKAVAFNKARNNRMGLTYNYGNISDVYIAKNKKDSGLFYAREMLVLSKDMPHRLVNAYGQMFDAEQALGHLDSAIVWLEKEHSLYDSITNLKKSEQLAQVETQTRYKTKEKEASIVALNSANSSKARSIGWLTVAIAAAGVLTALSFWLYRRSQKQKKQIAAQSNRLELMMKELHHRVKNNLQIVSSLLSLQTYRVQDEKALEAIKESRQRVQAMSLIHQRLYKTDNITSVNIKEYLTDLAEQLVAGYGYDKDSFTLDILVAAELLDVDKALPLGLIANEVITNALKYAYKDQRHPTLHITLTDTGEGLRLSIQDNGPGLDLVNWNSSGNRSFGKQLIGALSKQIRATHEINTASGTSFTFIIPKAA